MKKTGIISLLLVSALLCSCKGNSESSSESAGISLESSAEEPEASAKTAEEYANAVLNAVEFPDMEKYDDPETIDVIFKLDVSDFADYAIYSNLISSYLNRVIIVKPKDGKRSEVYEQLRAYYDDVIENGAFYFEQEEAAAGAEMGETKDGFIYIIIHKEGEKAANAMTNS